MLHLMSFLGYVIEKLTGNINAYRTMEPYHRVQPLTPIMVSLIYYI